MLSWLPRDLEIATITSRGLAGGSMILAFHLMHAGGMAFAQPLLSNPSYRSQVQPAEVSSGEMRQVQFAGLTPSTDVRTVATWIVQSADAGGLGFFIIDKIEARLYVFGPDARLRAATPVLLGGARGDDTVPGIGERAIADVLPHERTTPAGRFVGERGRNARGEAVVWVDYDAAVSMHRVVTGTPAERRLERLASPTAQDNRISYGCINVPAAFFDSHVLPGVSGARAIVYILPEIRSLREVFGIGEITPALNIHQSTSIAVPAPSGSADAF